MTLNDILRSFQPTLSFSHPISPKLYTIRHRKLKLLIRNHISFQLTRLSMTLTIFQG